MPAASRRTRRASARRRAPLRRPAGRRPFRRWRRPLHPGQPAAPAAPAPATGLSYFLYRLQKGDTLYSLSRRFHVSVEEIEQDNHITNPTDLPIGKPLLIRRVPGAEASPPAGAGSGQAPAAVGGVPRPVATTVLNRGKPGAQFWWPTGGTLAQRYGHLLHGFPDPGIAISAPAGTQVYAVADGKVVSIVLGGDNPQSAWGNVVSIEHAGDMTSWYGHLARVMVSQGANVKKGQTIGTVGRTGETSEPELAFRLYHNYRPIDPLIYLP